MTSVYINIFKGCFSHGLSPTIFYGAPLPLGRRQTDTLAVISKGVYGGGAGSYVRPSGKRFTGDLELRTCVIGTFSDHGGNTS